MSELKKCLIIDDMPERHKWLTQDYEINGYDIYNAYTFDEAVALIEQLSPDTFDLITFDHDLNDRDEKGNERTGATVARYMAENGLKCKEARIHSANPVGCKNIESILRSGEVTPERNDVYIDPFN